jgi:ABC-type transport system substrate-binding protein
VGSQAADELRKIDPRTNTIAFTKPLRPHSHVSSVAAGGGFAWAAITPDATVWKVGRDGSVIDTVALPAPARSLTYAAGAIWGAIGDRGEIVRIDPTTDAVRTYRVGHDVSDVDARNGLIAGGVRPSSEDLLAGLHGDVVRVGLESNTLFEIGNPSLPSTDPALYAPWDKNLLQFGYATCARLYDYRNVEGAAGRHVVPDLAAAFPKVSDAGRTYTIKLRTGFRFSPPSNAPVTAAAFREAIERDLSPAFAADYVDPRWKILVGAVDYNAGKTAHIAGVTADGDTLVLRFTQPVPDLPRLLALNVFCAVPPGTPIVPHGLESPVPSAGPYYLAALTDSVAILKPNPNYGGSRPRHLAAIVFELGVAPKDAAARIADGTLDYVHENDPALDPGTAAATGAGRRYQLTPDSTAHVEYLQFNVGRPLFASLRMRRAVQYALDRSALATADPSGAAIPATRLLSPKVAGFDGRQLYPSPGNLRLARKLAVGRSGHVVVYTFDEHPYTDAFNRALREQLAAIGLRMTILRAVNSDFGPGGSGPAKAARSDLIWGGGNAETSDPVSYLQQLFLPAQLRKRLDKIAGLSSVDREAQAVALARTIEKQSLFAVYDLQAIPELVSRRLGCIVHQPEYPGVDLAALCVRKNGG